MIRILSPAQGETLAPLSREMLDFIEKPEIEAAGRINWSDLKSQGIDRTVPSPVIVRYEPEINGRLVLTRCEAGAQPEYIPAVGGRAEIYDLMVGYDYTAVIEADGESSDAVRFSVSDQPPRWIYIDGCNNCRDIGGWKTDGGRRVRQGMIYRTSELDTHLVITDRGRKQLTDLGVKCEIDVRGLGDTATETMKGSGIRYHNIKLAAYDDIFTREQKDRYLETYRLLLDDGNYPLFIHCWGGIDRTGTWVYILNGMLGVQDGDLCLDYEISSFANWGDRSRNSDYFKAFKAGLMKYGDTPGEACVKFMLDCGLAVSEIDHLRNILTV